MAKKSTKKTLKPVRPQLGDGVEILNAGSVLEDPITRTLETNYMPYAMSVIVSRALPEIDGFKPAHRKLLYTMYEMGLLKGARTKSANIVGSTMHLNPHGDAAIYDTMVRMGRGNESLLMPFVDSKGNFGKAYSRDMSCAAARYTEAKLENVCEELFRDIDKETVDFVPNYDGTTTEPTLLPVTFHHSGQQYAGHRRGHGLQHLLVQPGRAVRHHRCPDEGPPPRHCHYHACSGLCGRRPDLVR